MSKMTLFSMQDSTGDHAGLQVCRPLPRLHECFL